MLSDHRRLTGIRYDEQPFAERTLTVMLGNWFAVEAVAAALIENRRIDGDQVEWMIDHA